MAPPFLIYGFQPHLIALCSLHTSNLGLCSWLNAGALLGLLDRGYYGPTTQPLLERLRAVTLRFRAWCSSLRKPQSQGWITVGMVHISDVQAPELTLKANHARVFLAYMAASLQAALENNRDDDDLLLMASACAYLAEWHRFLSPKLYPPLSKNSWNLNPKSRTLATKKKCWS